MTEPTALDCLYIVRPSLKSEPQSADDWDCASYWTVSGPKAPKRRFKEPDVAMQAAIEAVRRAGVGTVAAYAVDGSLEWMLRRTSPDAIGEIWIRRPRNPARAARLAALYRLTAGNRLAHKPVHGRNHLRLMVG